jgi:hypothetical protein
MAAVFNSIEAPDKVEDHDRNLKDSQFCDLRLLERWRPAVCQGKEKTKLKARQILRTDQPLIRLLGSKRLSSIQPIEADELAAIL